LIREGYAQDPITMTILLFLLLAVVFLASVAAIRIWTLSTKEKKKLIKKSIAAFYQRIEDWGVVARTPGFVPDYYRHYPHLEMLEKNHPIVRRECEALLARKEELTDMKQMGGNYTRAGIHVIQWKTFMFKSGDFIEENCALAPETAKLLRELPDLYMAFFSVLDPKQHIPPHWGYYKGFLRYHLGIVIPNDNEDQKCWLRVNSDRDDNLADDKSLVEKGERYYWRNGEGVVFDDTYLHDAANESDEVRVVLWLDLLKPHPWYIQIWSRLFLWIAVRDQSVGQIRNNSLVAPCEPEGQAKRTGSVR
jgi:aspartyl/asparaginyl beta-hydroxylase (cupin superfamily)